MEIVRAATCITVALSGRFDADAVAAMFDRWEQLSEEEVGEVVIDLSRVTFIDSAAIGMIAFLFKRLACRRRKLRLAGPSGQPKRLLELLRIDHVIEVVPKPPARSAPSMAGAFVRPPARTDAPSAGGGAA